MERGGTTRELVSAPLVGAWGVGGRQLELFAAEAGNSSGSQLLACGLTCLAVLPPRPWNCLGAPLPQR